ncbi:hypothetical protein FKP32DRAFT_1598096 [Trametes sanguinea]|nr:hypothetical protein FKP32DRAFT_1598096 [Trametes sanguinea]
MKFVQHTSIALFSAAYGTRYVAAATSLYIPFFDPDPVTAAVEEGVDDTGHTTWRLGPGVPSGTLTGDSDLFTSATLVADATSAHLVENDSALSFAITVDCGISNGVAVCTDVGSEAGFVSTTTATETASAFEVQVGSATGTPAGTATTTGSATQTAASTTGASAGSGSGSAPTAPGSSTGTSSASQSATQGAGNGASRLVSSVAGYTVVAMVVMFFV